MTLYLYSTLGCHLCEKAKTILWPLLAHYQCRLSEIDVATSDELIEKYGMRIPVLACINSSRELSWPFTLQEADGFLVKLLTAADETQNRPTPFPH